MSLCVIDIRLWLLLLCISAPLSMNADRTEDDLEVGKFDGLAVFRTMIPDVPAIAVCLRHF